MRLFFLSIMALLIALPQGKANNDWDNFKAPAVILENHAPQHPGSTTYLNLVKSQGFEDIQEWVQHCSKVLAKELFYTAAQANARNVKQITYKLNDGGALSYKDGSAPHITIGFDLNYLEKFVETHGPKAAAQELTGVLCHELAHAYQYEPKNAGSYQAGTEFFAFIEGVADLARLQTGGFNPPRKPVEGGSYLSGYTTTAFFYLWISKTLNLNFLRELNKSALEMGTWSLDLTLRSLFNMPAQTLWMHYQMDIDLYPWNNYTPTTKASFSFHDKIYFEGDTLWPANYSRLADSFRWSANGQQLTLNEQGIPFYVFPAKGDYRIMLEASNTKTQERDLIHKRINVLGRLEVFEFSRLGGQITAQHGDSPENEGPAMLFDNNENTKFLSFQKDTWVQLESPEAFVISSYALSSANDQPARDPKSWTLFASNDGINFDILDKQSSLVFDKRKQTHQIQVKSRKAYRYFRLQMQFTTTDDFGHDCIQLSEIRLWGRRQK